MVFAYDSTTFKISARVVMSGPSSVERVHSLTSENGKTHQKNNQNGVRSADFTDSTQAFGKQANSRKKTSSNYGFGTSSRAHATKTYVPNNF